MTFRFPGQYPDENIILAVRRHWIVLVLRCVPIVVLLALGVAAYILMRFYAPNFLLPPFFKATTLFFAFYAMFTWVFFYVVWIDYYFDIWLVTSYRIIDVQQKGLFNRIVAEQNLERVQDVTSAIQGILPTIMNYGEVSIQTAGAHERFLFEQVPKPNKVKRVVIDLAREAAERVEVVKHVPTNANQVGDKHYRASSAQPPQSEPEPPTKNDQNSLT